MTNINRSLCLRGIGFYSAALVFSANFTKIAVKCRQTAEKSNILDFWNPYGCVH